MPHYDGSLQTDRGDKGLCVLCHCEVRIITVPRPLTIAVTALIKRDDAVFLRKVQADEIPGMSGLMAAVQ